MRPDQIAKFLVALELLELSTEMLEEVLPSCAEYGHPCHHCTECEEEAP